MNDFNTIARMYDQLGQLVFFGRLHQSQITFIDQLKPNDRVLILGGGTGRILDDLAHLKLHIDFVEPSHAMIDFAKKRKCTEAHFHQIMFQDFQLNEAYDWVFCGFFLDLFPVQQLNENIAHIKSLMKPKAKLQVVDFQIIDESWWQNSISWLMHRFFKLFAQLQSDHLLNIRTLVRKTGYTPLSSKEFYNGFIFCEVFELTED